MGILFTRIIMNYTNTFTIVPRTIVEPWTENVFMEDLSTVEPVITHTSSVFLQISHGASYELVWGEKVEKA